MDSGTSSSVGTRRSPAHKAHHRLAARGVAEDQRLHDPAELAAARRGRIGCRARRVGQYLYLDVESERPQTLLHLQRRGVEARVEVGGHAQ